MEFFVVDPKTSTFDDWAVRIRSFLAEESLEYTEADGGLYYIGDDIAAPWDENSILFTVEDESEKLGVIELRDVDRHFYTFTDDLDIFDEQEVVDAVGQHARPAGTLYGFRWNNTNGCRFHIGPSLGFHFLCEDEDTDYPPVLELEEVWTTFFRVVHWLGNSTSRIQDLKGIHVEKVHMDFEVEVGFTHPASRDALNEILSQEEGYERTKDGLRARFRDRDIGWIREFVSLLPPEEEDYTRAFFRAVWRGMTPKGEREVFYAGIERRELRPFIQLPVHRTSKQLMDKFRKFFKGHRIDRQEYYITDAPS